MTRPIVVAALLTVALFGTPSLAATHKAPKANPSGTVTYNLYNKLNAKLQPTGLDAIPLVAPSATPTTFSQALVMLYRRFFKKTAKSPTQIVTYADDGATAITTQAITDDGAGNQTLGTAGRGSYALMAILSILTPFVPLAPLASGGGAGAGRTGPPDQILGPNPGGTGFVINAQLLQLGTTPSKKD